MFSDLVNLKCVLVLIALFGTQQQKEKKTIHREIQPSKY